MCDRIVSQSSIFKCYIRKEQWGFNTLQLIFVKILAHFINPKTDFDDGFSLRCVPNESCKQDVAAKRNSTNRSVELIQVHQKRRAVKTGYIIYTSRYLLPSGNVPKRLMLDIEIAVSWSLKPLLIRNKLDNCIRRNIRPCCLSGCWMTTAGQLIK